jgi:hypothetical protein
MQEKSWWKWTLRLWFGRIYRDDAENQRGTGLTKNQLAAAVVI